MTEVTSIITRTLVAKIKFSTVHSIENALAERTSAKYSIIIMSWRVPNTVIVIVNNYFPLPWQISLNRSAWPRFSNANYYQNSIRKAVITINSGIIMNKKSFLGNNSISSVLVEPVIAPLSAAISDSSAAIPIRYMRHAVIKPIARITPVIKRQM